MKWFDDTEIVTTEGSHMTINWLIFKNETCVALRRSTKYKICSNLYFFDYPVMVGSAHKAVVPSICRNTRFRQYGADSAYDHVLSTGLNQTVEKAEAMECDAQ